MAGPQFQHKQKNATEKLTITTVLYATSASRCINKTTVLPGDKRIPVSITLTFDGSAVP